MSEQDPRVSLLDWLAEHRGTEPAVLADLLRIGARDLVAVAVSTGTARSVATEARDLAAAGWVAPDDAALTAAVTVVGARVVLDDPDNLGEWAAVAHRFQGLTPPRGRAYAFQQWCRLPATEIVTGFHDAGRSPAYALAMLDRAATAEVPADAFGYGDEMRPETFTALVESGVTASYEYRDLTTGEDPMTPAEIIGWTSQGIDPTVLHVARRDGVPREQWATLLPGIPGRWFPRDVGHTGDLTASLLDEGYTWDDLATLRDRGWGDLGPYASRHGIKVTSGRGGSTARVTPEIALRLSRVAPYDDVVRWAKALTAGKRGADGTRECPPLVWPHHTVIGHDQEMSALIAAGLSPSHLDTYRAAGCRSVDDVLAAVVAGITPARVRALLNQHGTKAYHYYPKRIASLAALLRAHQQEG